MSKWNEYLTKSFSQDDELIKITRDVENIIALEKSLHAKIYDGTGNIKILSTSGSSVLLSEMIALDGNIKNANALLAVLLSTYRTGNTLASLNDKLTLAYKTELMKYRADFTKLLE